MNPNDKMQHFLSVVAKAHAYDESMLQQSAGVIDAKQKRIAALEAELAALKAAAPKDEP